MQHYQRPSLYKLLASVLKKLPIQMHLNFVIGADVSSHFITAQLRVAPCRKPAVRRCQFFVLHPRAGTAKQLSWTRAAQQLEHSIHPHSIHALQPAPVSTA